MSHLLPITWQATTAFRSQDCWSVNQVESGQCPTFPHVKHLTGIIMLAESQQLCRATFRQVAVPRAGGCFLSKRQPGCHNLWRGEGGSLARLLGNVDFPPGRWEADVGLLERYCRVPAADVLSIMHKAVCSTMSSCKRVRVHAGVLRRCLMVKHGL